MPALGGLSIRRWPPNRRPLIWCIPSTRYNCQNSHTIRKSRCPALNSVRRPYDRNKGLIFVPAAGTWHSDARAPINGVRKSIIINYVTSDRREKWELA